MMHAAPIAPSAPAIVAVMSPVALKFDRPPCAESAATGTSTPIRKYATPTQSNAFSGFPSWTPPWCSNTPYTPHDRTAPATNNTHIRPLVCAEVLTTVMKLPILSLPPTPRTPRTPRPYSAYSAAVLRVLRGRTPRTPRPYSASVLRVIPGRDPPPPDPARHIVGQKHLPGLVRRPVAGSAGVPR